MIIDCPYRYWNMQYPWDIIRLKNENFINFSFAKQQMSTNKRTKCFHVRQRNAWFGFEESKWRRKKTISWISCTIFQIFSKEESNEF